MLEHPVEFVDELSIFVGDMVSTYSCDLPGLHEKCLDEHQLCSAKTEMIRQFIEVGYFTYTHLQPAAAEDNDDDDNHLVPKHLRSLEKELTGFLKDLGIMDKENLGRLQILALYERRRATVMVNLVEDWIRTQQLAGYVVWTALKSD